MKSYIIVLFPEKEAGRVIEKFRIKITGKVLVDNLPPHITFKCCFTLNSKFSKQNLIDHFKTLRYKKFKINFMIAEVWDDVLVLVGQSSGLSSAHRQLVKSLDGKIITMNPEWEMENYTIHITLLRGATAGVVPPKIGRIILDRMTLYEIGSGNYAKKIVTTTLN